MAKCPDDVTLYMVREHTTSIAPKRVDGWKQIVDKQVRWWYHSTTSLKP